LIEFCKTATGITLGQVSNRFPVLLAFLPPDSTPGVTVKERFKMFRRKGGMFYARDTATMSKEMVSLGEANSRMKDFYDIHFLSLHYAFDGDILRQAIAATFTGRGTAIPIEEIYPLSTEFFRNPARQRLWTGFLKRLGLKDVEPSFELVTQQIAAFVKAPVQAASQNRHLSRNWPPSGPWQ
jgi:hypothetical protein